MSSGVCTTEEGSGVARTRGIGGTLKRAPSHESSPEGAMGSGRSNLQAPSGALPGAAMDEASRGEGG